jgi:hypothetical protein
MQALKIYLDDVERDALKNLSIAERRDPRSQAALLIRDGLQRAGLLPNDALAPHTLPVQPSQPEVSQ